MTVLRPIQAFCDIVSDNAKPGMRVAEVGVYDGSTTFGYIDIIKENKGKFMNNQKIDWLQA